MIPKELSVADLVEPYTIDGRRTVEELDGIFSILPEKFGWKKMRLFTQNSPGIISQDVYFYLSPNNGPAIWLLGGIHGEEPAPPNAYAESIFEIAEFGKNIPIVMCPVINALSYSIGTRFPPGYLESISDMEHSMPSLTNPFIPRKICPSSPEASVLTTKIIEILPLYPPFLVYDGHEDLVDEDKPSIMEEDHLNPRCYIYSQGYLGPNDPIANAIVNIFYSHGFPLIQNGKTRFPHEIVRNGIVYRDDGEIIRDGSIEEFFALDGYFDNNQNWVKKIPTRHIITGETTVNGFPLARRVAAHCDVIKSIAKFWEIANA